MHAHAQSKKKQRVHTFPSCEHSNYFLIVLHLSWQLMFNYREKSLRLLSTVQSKSQLKRSFRGTRFVRVPGKINHK